MNEFYAFMSGGYSGKPNSLRLTFCDECSRKFRFFTIWLPLARLFGGDQAHVEPPLFGFVPWRGILTRR